MGFSAAGQLQSLEPLLQSTLTLPPLLAFNCSLLPACTLVSRSAGARRVPRSESAGQRHCHFFSVIRQLRVRQP